MQTVPRGRLDFNHIHKVGVLRIALGKGGHVRLCQGVYAPALIDAVFVRGIPRALRQTEHAGHDARRHFDPHNNCATVIEYLDRVVVFYAALRRIGLVHPKLLGGNLLKPGDVGVA